MSRKEFIFIGMEEAGYACLESLLKDGIAPKAVFTLHESLQDKIIAYKNFEELKLAQCPLYKTTDINDRTTIEAIISIKPDLIVTAYWSQLLGREILQIPPLGCTGLHGTLLPKHRGRAPIPWSIIYGLRRGGMTMFYMTSNPDDGDIIAQESYDITETDYASDLYSKAKTAACNLLCTYVPLLLEGTAPRIKQDLSLSDYWHKRTPQDGIIDWDKSAKHLFDWIRALSHPFPGAFFFIEDKNNIVFKSSIYSTENCFEPGKIYWELSETDIIVGTGGGALTIDHLLVDGKQVDNIAFRKIFF